MKIIVFSFFVVVVTVFFSSLDGNGDHVEKDKINGQGAVYCLDGIKYASQWKREKEDGSVTMTSPDGKKHVGQ